MAVLAFAACGDDGPTATLTSPADGATVAGGVALAMSAEGVTIEPAGDVRDGYGHFHVIADAECVDTGTGIGKDADHLHFGAGQSDGRIYLEPGTHQLCLQVGDGTHAALDITDTITIDVAVTSREQWCDVVGEIDTMFETVDGDEDFAVQRVGWENIRRLAEQAKRGVEFVDASVRDDVAVTVEFAAELATALASAESPEATEAAVVPIFESMPDELPGADWILATCGVDIDG